MRYIIAKTLCTSEEQARKWTSVQLSSRWNSSVRKSPYAFRGPCLSEVYPAMPLKQNPNVGPFQFTLRRGLGAVGSLCYFRGKASCTFPARNSGPRVRGHVTKAKDRRSILLRRHAEKGTLLSFINWPVSPPTPPPSPPFIFFFFSIADYFKLKLWGALGDGGVGRGEVCLKSQ